MVENNKVGNKLAPSICYVASNEGYMIFSMFLRLLAIVLVSAAVLLYKEYKVVE